MTDRLPTPQARLLAAVIHVYARDGRCTVRTVAAAAGRTPSVTHEVLRRLRDAGLVAWTDGQVGTLRPCVWPVNR